MAQTNKQQWTCTVTLSEDHSSTQSINWSVSNKQGAQFDQSSGYLSSGEQQTITISNLTCQNKGFTFTGSNAAPDLKVTWSCTTPQPTPTPTPTPGPTPTISVTPTASVPLTLKVNPLVYNAGRGCTSQATITLAVTRLITCPFTLSSDTHNQGDLSWTVGANDVGISVANARTGGLLHPGTSDSVNIIVDYQLNPLCSVGSLTPKVVATAVSWSCSAHVN